MPHSDITDPSAPVRNGIDQWSKRGGIVGRGILLDYSRWAEKQGIQYSPIERHGISEKDLEAVAAWQGTTFRQGDILLIRSGFVKWYKESSPQERRSGTAEGVTWAGVEGTKESVEWIWNKHFAAVAGDANVFEAWPAKDERYSGFTAACNCLFVMINSTDYPRAARQSDCALWDACWRDV